MKVQKGFAKSRSFPSFVAVGVILAVFLLMAPSALAASTLDNERMQTKPSAGWWWFHGASPDYIKGRVEAGYRLIDLEVESTSPYRFSGAMVRNQGDHQKSWWWYYGITSDQVKRFLTVNQARLIDQEVYRVNGAKRYAVVMTRNTGSQATGWWYYSDATLGFVMDKAKENGARIIELDTYFVRGQRMYSAIMTSNTGSSNRGWWVYYNVSPQTIGTKLRENQARLVDVERYSASTFTVVMNTVKDPSEAGRAWWFYGQTAAQINNLVQNYGARVIDVEPYQVNGKKRFLVLLLNNSNSLTTRVGNILRDNTDGAVGLYLKRVDGPILASLQEDRIFEPASSIKSLVHVHAMLQTQNGAVTLQTQIPWLGDSNKYDQNGNYKPGGDDCYSNNIVPESNTLQAALKLMMENSDNALAQALRDYFGDTSIDDTRQMLGMTDTLLQHSVGCGGEAVANHNQLTLVDSGRLFEAVAGVLLTPANRATFYDLMSNGVFVSSVVNEEAVKLGKQNQAAAFINRMEMAYKGGSYGLSDGKYRSRVGWAQIPFNGGTVSRQYVFGVFIDQASDGAKANQALGMAVVELFRDEIRAALKSW